MLIAPRMITTIPEPMTRRQKVVPIDSSDVACLFKLPRMETPIMIIIMPKVTKP